MGGGGVLLQSRDKSMIAGLLVDETVRKKRIHPSRV